MFIKLLLFICQNVVAVTLQVISCTIIWCSYISLQSYQQQSLSQYVNHILKQDFRYHSQLALQNK